MAQIHALTPEGRLPSQAVAHVQELIATALADAAHEGQTLNAPASEEQASLND